jgi:hypothetical protein
MNAIEQDYDNDFDLDTSWIQKEQRIQNIQNNHIREPMDSIHAVFIYINQNNYIDKISREFVTLTQNQQGTGSLIPYNILLKLIQNKKIKTSTSKYQFSNAFSFIIDFDTQQIQPFSNTNTENLENNSFFKEISVTQDINIPSSVFIFHNINTIYFLYKEVLFEKHNITLKSILKPTIKQSNGEPDKKLKKYNTKKVRIFDKNDINNQYKQKVKNKQTRKRRI